MPVPHPRSEAMISQIHRSQATEDVNKHSVQNVDNGVKTELSWK